LVNYGGIEFIALENETSLIRRNAKQSVDAMWHSKGVMWMLWKDVINCLVFGFYALFCLLPHQSVKRRRTKTKTKISWKNAREFHPSTDVDSEMFYENNFKCHRSIMVNFLSKFQILISDFTISGKMQFRSHIKQDWARIWGNTTSRRIKLLNSLNWDAGIWSVYLLP
jgi:hypothetical protein